MMQNRKYNIMADQTGNTYISGTVIDSIEIPTENLGTIQRQWPQIIARTTDNRK